MLFQSVGDSESSSESTASGPCRSEDSRSISPIPIIRPKTLIHSRAVSNISTCSSSGNSPGVHNKSNSETHNMSESSHLQSHQQVTVQAPPRTKKRAAPLPPTTPGSNANSSATSNNLSPSFEKNITACSTPLSSNNNYATKVNINGASVERPTPPRKKEAPRQPKLHPPLAHHQSLPLNHGRHQQILDRKQEVSSQSDFGQLDR